MQRDDIDINHFKERLASELQRLTDELKSVGRVNPGNPKDWEAVPGNTNIQTADKNEAADRIEEYEENTAILKTLEGEYNDVKRALEKIELGTYGYCEKGGQPIEVKRLEAYPAARLCLKHLHEEEGGGNDL